MEEKIVDNPLPDEKPGGYITNIKFNNETNVNINRDDIIVFVGPNNAGKSQSLKDIFSLTTLDLQQTLVLGVFLLLCWPTMGAILTVFEKARRILLKAEKPHGRGEKD